MLGTEALVPNTVSLHTVGPSGESPCVLRDDCMQLSNTVFHPLVCLFTFCVCVFVFNFGAGGVARCRHCPSVYKALVSIPSIVKIN